jgi:SAM-dependent methyltransferase
MKIDILSVLLDWELFLKKYRFGIAEPSNLLALKKAELMGDEVTALRILTEFPEFSDFVRFRQSNHPKLTMDEIRNLSDPDLVRRQDLQGIPYGLLSPIEVESKILAMILKQTNLSANLVVDIGCGTAHRLTFLKSRGYLKSFCVGVDLSTVNLKRAQEIASSERVDIDLLNASAEHIPLGDGSAGQAVMIDSLQWVLNWQEALYEVSRVLGPGGELLLVFNTHCERVFLNERAVTRVLREYGMRSTILYGYNMTSVHMRCSKV